MTRQEKISWLRRYQESLCRERYLIEDLEMQHARAEKLTAAISPLPGAKADGQAVPRAVERIIEVEARLQRQILECRKTRRQIEHVIQKIEDQRTQDIFRYRYLCGMTWECTAEGVHASTRWTILLHNRAVDALCIPGSSKKCTALH